LQAADVKEDIKDDSENAEEAKAEDQEQVEDTKDAVDDDTHAVGSTLFAGKYEIDFRSRLKDLEHGTNKVYSTKDSKKETDCIAVLAPVQSLPRVNFSPNYKGMQSTNLLRLLASGVLEDGPGGKGYMVFVFENPEPPPIITSWDQEPEKLSEEELLEGFVKPILSVLKEFHIHDMVHGAINPKNIYMACEGEGNEAILGECVSHAPSLTQHILFEPIERSLADPEGRGVGTGQDDLYAFGMCVAIMARGVNPIKTMTDEEIIKQKIEGGSYSVIIGRERLPSGLTEFLRGVLNDDPNQRWDFEDVEKWLEGRRLSPRQSRVQYKAQRPFTFLDEKISYLRLLVRAFSKKVSDAGTALGSEAFITWFKRNIDDDNLQVNVENIIERNKASSKTGTMRDRYVCEMCMAMDPSGPVRYQDVSVMPRSVGNALAYAFAHQKSVQPYAQILNYQLPTTWLSLQLNAPADAATLASQYESCKGFLNKKMPGYGIERVVYMLSKDAACYSPMLRGFSVYTSEQLLFALEKLASKGAIKDTILDRHMVAFLAVRDQRMIEPQISKVSSNNKTYQILGVLRTLASIQKANGGEALPALGDLIVERSKPLIDRINEKSLRENLIKKVDSMKGQGNLNALLTVLDNDNLLKNDAQRFVLAQREFQAISQKYAGLKAAVMQKKQFGLHKGRQVAMLVSTAIGTAIFLMNIVSFVFMR
jgi:hypothetical protein